MRVFKSITYQYMAPLLGIYKALRGLNIADLDLFKDLNLHIDQAKDQESI